MSGNWIYSCDLCGALSSCPAPDMACIPCKEALSRIAANADYSPLVSSARVTAIKAFVRSLELVQEAYGVKLKTDSSGDLLIIDTTTTLPDSYEWSAWIDRFAKLHIAEWVDEPETGEKR